VLAQKIKRKGNSEQLESRRVDRDLFCFFVFFFFFGSLTLHLSTTPGKKNSLQNHHHTSVSSAFSHLLNLHNLSEEMSTAQHERAIRMGEVRKR